MIIPPLALKCYLFIVRKTVGWQKQKDTIPLTQFATATGKENRAILTALGWLEDNELIVRNRAKGVVTEYSLNLNCDGKKLKKLAVKSSAVKCTSAEKCTGEVVQFDDTNQCSLTTKSSAEKCTLQKTLSKDTTQNTQSARQHEWELQNQKRERLKNHSDKNLLLDFKIEWAELGGRSTVGDPKLISVWDELAAEHGVELAAVLAKLRSIARANPRHNGLLLQSLSDAARAVAKQAVQSEPAKTLCRRCNVAEPAAGCIECADCMREHDTQDLLSGLEVEQ